MTIQASWRSSSTFASRSCKTRTWWNKTAAMMVNTHTPAAHATISPVTTCPRNEGSTSTLARRRSSELTRNAGNAGGRS
jgi:hypothetical protein